MIFRFKIMNKYFSNKIGYIIIKYLGLDLSKLIKLKYLDLGLDLYKLINWKY